MKSWTDQAPNTMSRRRLFVCPNFVVPLFRFALSSSGQIMGNWLTGLEGLRGSRWDMPAIFAAIFADEYDDHDEGSF